MTVDVKPLSVKDEFSGVEREPGHPLTLANGSIMFN